MILKKIILAWLMLFLVSFLSLPSLAQQGRGALERLQQQPMTLFDAGMKSLRRLALDTAEKMAAKSGMEVTSSVFYKHAVPTIEIAFNFKTHNTGTIEQLRQQCLDIRRDTILKLFRIGLTGYATNLSTNERIRRRIGGQFAPEPTTSTNEIISLGEQLGQITFFEVTLLTTSEPTVSVSCRGFASQPMAK